MGDPNDSRLMWIKRPVQNINDPLEFSLDVEVARIAEPADELNLLLCRFAAPGQYIVPVINDQYYNKRGSRTYVYPAVVGHYISGVFTKDALVCGGPSEFDVVGKLMHLLAQAIRERQDQTHSRGFITTKSEYGYVTIGYGPVVID